MVFSRKQFQLLAMLLVAAGGMMAVSVGDARESALPETVSLVDLDRYLGTWYEIAGIPNRFQRHCRGNTTADYERADQQRIRVINSCLDGDGRVDQAEGVARIVDPESNAKLEVSFVSLFGWQLFWGDYWILDLATDYSHVVVGTPDYRYGWILSRTPVMSVAVRHRLTERLRSLGYDPSVFVDTPQGIE